MNSGSFTECVTVSRMNAVRVDGRSSSELRVREHTVRTSSKDEVDAFASFRYPLRAKATYRLAATLLIPAIWSAARFRRKRVRTIWPYVLVSGTLSWVGFYLSGVHPALALLPIVRFLPHAARDL